MNKAIIFAIIIIILVIAFFWVWQTRTGPVVVPGGIILFYGEGCPHCEVVDDFISENKIEDKVSFARLEVWYNATGKDILAQVVQKCGISSNQVGVPFLYDGENCFIGDTDVINFFKNEAGIN